MVSNEHRRAAYAARRDRNPEKHRAQVRAQHLWKKYRLTPEAATALWREQGYQCAACGVPVNDPGTTTGPDTNIDHDHASGAVRGILCRSCNLTLGVALEDTARLLGLAAYIEEHTHE